VITRTHIKDDAPSTATYSDCERYRYALTRTWDAQGKRVLFVMLNPSKATEVQNDPTVERCERRARALGFGAFQVTNIFAWRDTDPFQMRKAADPVGPENDKVIRDGAAWGAPWARPANGTPFAPDGKTSVRIGAQQIRAPQAPALYQLCAEAGPLGCGFGTVNG